jgi:hypothetical protein
MKKLLNFLDHNFWLVLFLIPLPSILALFLKSGYFGVSDDIHIAWLYEMDQAIRSGKFPPRYTPSLSYGFGYPLFNFVFPLPFYLGEVFHLLGFSLVNSVKIVLALSLFLSFFSMYLLLKKFTDKYLSLLGATIYLYAPYRATDVYVRGAIGESLAFVFLPLVLLSFFSLLDEDKKKINWRWVAIGSLSIFGLILSHNITSYMFLPLLSLVFFGLFLKHGRLIVKPFLLTFLLGFLVSSYFWVPAILDSRLMKYDTVFNYSDHFPTFKQLITPYFGYGASVPGPYDGMSFFIGLPQIVVLVLSMFLLFRNFKKFSLDKSSVLIWSFVVFFASIFMTNHRSSFIWQNFPFLPYFQFPWRFLTLIIFTSAIFVITFEKLKIRGFVIFSLICLSLYFGFSYFKPSEYLKRQDDYYLNRYIPLPEASEEYKKTSEEYLRLPVLTELRPDRVMPILFGSNFIVKDFKENNSLDFKAKIEVFEDKTDVNIRRYYFPGWVVKLDGEEVTIDSGKPFGQIVVSVAKGEHDLEVFYNETLRNKLLDLVSFLSFSLCLYLFLNKKKYA